MFWGLMTHVIARLFNTFASIYILCNNYGSLSISVNQLIAVKALKSHFNTLSVSLAFPNILKKDLQKPKKKKKKKILALLLQQKSVFQG